MVVWTLSKQSSFRDTFDGGHADRGNNPLRLLHDGPMLFTTCRATLYCRASVVQHLSSPFIGGQKLGP